jgi:hypothetical protein
MSNVEADQLSGYEPQLSITYGKRGQQRLSLRFMYGTAPVKHSPGVRIGKRV